jgi:hypothetical protein
MSLRQFPPTGETSPNMAKLLAVDTQRGRYMENYFVVALQHFGHATTLLFEKNVHISIIIFGTSDLPS